MHTHILVIRDKELDYIDGTGELVWVYTQECLECGWSRVKYCFALETVEVNDE